MKTQTTPTTINQGTTRYRPTVADMMDVSKFQTLSLKDAGQFDTKFHFVNAGGEDDKMVKTGWTIICRHRQACGISRKARIKGA